MPRRPTLARRITTATRWPVGIALTSWSYMWRTTPMHRREEVGALDDDRPPELPPGVSREEIQPAADGAGPLFHPGGTAVVVHAGQDDQHTDPSGGSGTRVACGVVKRGT